MWYEESTVRKEVVDKKMNGLHWKPIDAVDRGKWIGVTATVI